MRKPIRIAGAAGLSALMLLAVGCGGPGSGKAAPGPSEAVTPAKPLPMKATPRQATWTDSDDKAHPLRITPTRLARGSDSDLSHIRLDGDLKGKVPYYLTFSYTNTGKKTVKNLSPERNFSVTGADGQPAQPVSLFQSNPLATSSGLPPECREGGASQLAAGATAALCQIYMLPKGQPPTTVSYKDDGGDTLIWKVGEGGAEGGASDGILPAGKPADGVTEDADKRPVSLRITPKSVRAGSIADLGRFDLDADQKKMVPYYVTMQYRNSGKYDLLPSMNDGVTLQTAAGQTVRKMVLIDIGGPGVSQCPEAVPDKMLKPNGVVTECSIHLLPKGDAPTAVIFNGEGEGSHQVTWRASVAGK
ncbi:hypothetical protein [Streptomyces endophytica]|uniref:Lipoprotein n=1 Tax=Streptomyces endophytica TaxID=2991496 RepID=A0ABY6P9L7_9ACTN|nr:hypothetical protein [Streptomyces endophytica]UZJ30287.1 hypothetical protein OJ254_07640 [Streptomyces endophytica]